MNILFITLSRIDTLEKPSIYCDLLRKLRDNSHNIYTVSPNEKRLGLPTQYQHADNAHMLTVATGNVTKEKNLIKKGVATLTLEMHFIRAIKKYFSDVRFDLVMYSTPPITFGKTIEYIKKRDGAKSYLLLKDIFPQNAVDIGMMKKDGVTGVLYQYFRRKEKKLYAVSDRIGCMSQANVDYVLKHNPEVPASKVEICPNSIEVQDMSVTPQERVTIREKYEIPLNKKIFVYGGNLGKPQGIPFLMECLKSQSNNCDAYFLVVGAGTEAVKLKNFINDNDLINIRVMDRLPKEDYEKMVAACDVGMIFLDHRFTIPNFPSRLLSYMQAKLPVLCCTDPNTDVGQVCVDGGFGWWCESNDTAAFDNCVEQALHSDLTQMGERSFAYLNNNYNVQSSCDIIVKGLGVK